MSEYEKITFVFTPADGEDFPHPIEFTYKIKKGDYVNFVDKALHICGDVLTDEEKDIIIETYPKLKKVSKKCKFIGDFFEQSCCFVGVEKISKRKYELGYDT